MRSAGQTFTGSGTGKTSTSSKVCLCLWLALVLMCGCSEPARSPASRGAPSESSAAGSITRAEDPSSAADFASDGVEVVRRYYAAINARDFRRAYELWEGRGVASRQTFEEFAAGYQNTSRVTIDFGEPGPIGAAAGSRYVSIPVTIHAVTSSGRTQRFRGSYTLRRAVVDGATPQQRRWHIYSASIDTAR